jgi:amino acid transporter
MTVVPPRLSDAVRSLSGTDISSLRAWWETQSEEERPEAAGPRANRRLTALTGAIILPLALLVLLTGLLFGSFWHVHYFLAYLLLPIVLLKVGSTTYRAVRYYLQSGAYRFIRPPYPIGRITSPLLVLSVIVLFTSGIAMWLTHSRGDPWGFLHTDAAIAFCGLALLHLAMYLPEALHAMRREVHPPETEPRTRTRSRVSRPRALLYTAVVAGLLLALLTIAPSRFPARGHRHRNESALVR